RRIRSAIEIAGQDHARAGRQLADPLQDLVRAQHARADVLGPIREVGIEVVERTAAVAQAKPRPGHHARIRLPPGPAAGYLRRIGEPEIAGAQHLQALRAIDHAHVLALGATLPAL